MRIDRLDLIAYGKFSGTSLDLSAGDRGLHVIHGPNEAGKSTTLRALGGWLFGFPPRLKDNFVHEYSKIRVGGVLRDEDGTTHHLIRRKSNTRSLRLGDDEADADEEFLRNRLLGGIDEPLYERTFQIDHSGLSAGGEAAMKAGGEFAKILFGSAIDLASLRAYQKSLEDEIDGLFKPTGQKPTINKAIKEIEEAGRAIEAASIRGADWQEKVEERDRLEALRRETEGKWRMVKVERDRTERVRLIRPELSRLLVVQSELAGLVDAPRLPTDFAERRSIAERAGLESATTLSIQTKQLDRLASEADLLPPPSPILADSQPIRELLDDLIRRESAAKSREAKIRERAEERATAERLKAQLSADSATRRLDHLQSPGKLKPRIVSLTQDGWVSLRDAEGATQAVDRVEKELAGLAEIAGEDQPPDPSGLARALIRARSLGDVQQARTQAVLELAKAERQAATWLAKLGNPAPDPFSAMALPIPSIEVLHEHRDTAKKATSTLESAQDARRTIEAELRNLNHAIELREASDDVPELHELVTARTSRDEIWAEIKAEHRAGGASRNELLVGFEVALALSDSLADRLRLAADFVAARDRDHTAKRELEESERENGIRFEAAMRSHHSAAQAWTALWKPSGVQPRSPSEMINWATDHNKLSEAAIEIATKRERLAEIDAACDREISSLNAELGPLGERCLLGESLMSAIERAEAAHVKAQAAHQNRRLAESTRLQMTASLREAKDRERQFWSHHQAWREAWMKAVEPLGLGVEATSEKALATLDEITEFDRATRRVEALDQEISELDRNDQRFLATLKRLAREHTPHRQDAPPNLAASALKSTLEAASGIEATRTALRASLAKVDAAIRQAEANAERSRLALEALAREAGAATLDELPEIERRASEKLAAEKEQRAIESRLHTIAPGISPEALLLEVEHFEGQDLDSSILNLAEEFERLDTERAELTKRVAAIGESIRLTEDFARQAKAATATADREHLMGALETNVDRLVHLKLSLAVLNGAIEEFRATNEGPVLTRAGEHFARLTLGEFSGLRTDLDDRNDLVVLGVRSLGASRLGVREMSDGTVDALYLAIKLASLEHHLRTRPPLPLILDDLLIQFDDDRAVAALECLAELSRRTQVLFFTHHDHLVGLARERFPEDLVHVHRLTRSSSSVNGS